MLKLTGYLKPYTIKIFYVIALLSVQAACDLALPGYMSRIVNSQFNVGVVDAGT